MPLLDGSNPKGRDLQRSTSKAYAIRQLFEIQETLKRRIDDPMVDEISLSQLASTFIKVRDAIRIEKGLIKPGSRNISVKEEPIKRKGAITVAPFDVLEAKKQLGITDADEVKEA